MTKCGHSFWLLRRPFKFQLKNANIVFFVFSKTCILNSLFTSTRCPKCQTVLDREKDLYPNHTRTSFRLICVLTFDEGRDFVLKLCLF